MDPSRKKKKLLYLGGEQIQEIFSSFPESKVVVETGDEEKTLDEYESLLFRFDQHFAPKLNITAERHTLRNIKQEYQENFDTFCERIRNQIAKCGNCVEDKELEIIQQIIEGCKNKLLRNKLLAKDRSLDKVMSIGRNFEESERQNKEFDKTAKPEVLDINRITPRSNWNRSSGNNQGFQKRGECFRCGNKGHYANDKSCPALNNSCNNCNKIGHFAKKCHQRGLKRKSSDETGQKPKVRRGQKPKESFMLTVLMPERNMEQI